jgi:hypothetical protein
VGRYVSEAWFGRQLARHPPAYRRVQAQPEPTRPAGMAPIITGTVLLLLAVSIPFPFPFLNVKLLGLILIVAGLVKARALQRASSWLWRNRPKVMAARVLLDTLLKASAPVARRVGADQLADGRFTVTVIVPAYNEEDVIRDTLDA